jgi:Helix-turn-helix domain
MSIALMSEVWKCVLTRTKQAVLLVMADHAHDDGSKCFPSVGLIVWKTGLKERSVQYAIHSFVSRGILVKVTTKRPGQYQPNEYSIHLDKVARKALFVPLHEQPMGARLAPLKADPGVQNEGSGVQKDAPGVQNRGVRGAIAIAHEPPYEPSFEPPFESLFFASPDGEKAVDHPEVSADGATRAAAIGALEESFVRMTGLDLPPRKTVAQNKAGGKRWWNPLAEIWTLCDGDLCAAEVLMRRAVQQLKDQELTLSAPASILNTARSLHAIGRGSVQGHPTAGSASDKHRAAKRRQNEEYEAYWDTKLVASHAARENDKRMRFGEGPDAEASMQAFEAAETHAFYNDPAPSEEGQTIGLNPLAPDQPVQLIPARKPDRGGA